MSEPDFFDDYVKLVRGERFDESVLVAQLPQSVEPPTEESVAEALLDAGIKVSSIEELEDGDGLKVEAEIDGVLGRYFIRPGEGGPNEHQLHMSDLTAEESAAALRSEWSVGVKTQFDGADPLGDFHRQLKVLAALCPDATAMVDLNACAVRSGSWLRDLATSRVPPAPQYLFNTHAVYDEQNRMWLHTHGLLRLGCPELEALNVTHKQDNGVAHVLNTAAAMIIERGLPAPGEPFTVGRGLELAWLPWQAALDHAKDGPGAEEDRDENHSAPAAVLFAPVKSFFGKPKLKSLSAYKKVLENNPVFYISQMETNRMAILAKDRLETFRALFQRYGADESWAFLVKLGYPVDDDPESREHLWFRVHGFDGLSANATLLNQPYGVRRLKEGDRGTHSLELLSSWTIHSPRGNFDPETAHRLLAAPASRAELN